MGTEIGKRLRWVQLGSAIPITGSTCSWPPSRSSRETSLDGDSAPTPPRFFALRQDVGRRKSIRSPPHPGPKIGARVASPQSSVFRFYRYTRLQCCNDVYLPHTQPTDRNCVVGTVRRRHLRSTRTRKTPELPMAHRDLGTNSLTARSLAWSRTAFSVTGYFVATRTAYEPRTGDLSKLRIASPHRSSTSPQSFTYHRK